MSKIGDVGSERVSKNVIVFLYLSEFSHCVWCPSEIVQSQKSESTVRKAPLSSGNYSVVNRVFVL